jgi:hypothetical protein
MDIRRSSVAALAAVATLVVATASPVAARRPPPAPRVTALATFGRGLGSGSTIGPDGALYVTDGNAGRVLRVDPRSGEVTTYAGGLPPQLLGLGGAMDLAFVDGTAYVLVTMVGGHMVTPGGLVPFGDGATNGIYRLDHDGRFDLVADIGAFAEANPPSGFAIFLTTGVQYAMQPFDGGFLVTDGHHNRLLRVGLDGSISVAMSFPDIVPTGLETSGQTVYVAEAGPVPHHPQDAKVVAIRGRSARPRAVASGRPGDIAGLAVDIEQDAHHHLYALLQGVWDLPNDPANAGQPAAHDTGALVEVEPDGTFTPIVEHLDQPTSLEIVGDTAYVIGLGGTVTRIDHLTR